MTLQELKDQIKEYQYLEDTKIIDIALASMIANQLRIGDPVWLIIIGASSGGKSQILRPLALGNPNFVHRIDDITENTFLSGSKVKKGEQSNSLMDRVGGHGILAISDLTVLMSKSSESRATILSQFRMLYDGEMVKHSGNKSEPITWKGYIGIIAGSTPSIYKHFEEVSDMGERFIYFRMKEFDSKKATHLALSRSIYGKELDEKLASLYKDYLAPLLSKYKETPIPLDETTKERIIEIASFAERVRTVASMEWRGERINKIPVSAQPMRVALQLTAIAKSLSVIKHHETGSYTLEEEDLSVLDWVGYSLANEEKRACLKIIASVKDNLWLSTSSIADEIGLDTSIVRTILQNLSAVNVLKRMGDEVSGNLTWAFKDISDYNLVRRIEHITKDEDVSSRSSTLEEHFQHEF